MLVEKKKRWPLGGIFELPTWFITILRKGVAEENFYLIMYFKK
jgi:hypothetical protein